MHRFLGIIEKFCIFVPVSGKNLLIRCVMASIMENISNPSFQSSPSPAEKSGFYFCMESKYFIRKGDFIHPKHSPYSSYNIPIEELPLFEGDGTSRWFVHMVEKNWFTEDYFWDLVNVAKQLHPKVNFDKHIFQAARVIEYNSILENPDKFKVLTRLYLIAE